MPPYVPSPDPTYPTPLRLQLEGSSNIWEFTQPAFAAGRAPDCDLVLDGNAYPMVSRRHLLFEWSGGAWHWRDAGTQNGVWRNGSRTASDQVRPGDRLQLGAEGPVLRVLAHQAAPTYVAASATPTQAFAGAERTVIAQPAAMDDMPAWPPHGGTPAMATEAAAPVWHAAQPSPPGVTSSRPPMPTPAWNPAHAAPQAEMGARSYSPPAPTPPPTASRLATSASPAAPELPEIRRQVRSIRQLALSTLFLNVLLFAILLYQIQQTQYRVQQLRSQAKNAVQMLQPQLDQRLNGFSTQIAQADVKIKRDMQVSEQQFMQRLNRQLPIMLDRYIQNKMSQFHAVKP